HFRSRRPGTRQSPGLQRRTELVVRRLGTAWSRSLEHSYRQNADSVARSPRSCPAAGNGSVARAPWVGMCGIPIRPVPRISRPERDPTDVLSSGARVLIEVNQSGAPSVITVAAGVEDGIVARLEAESGYPGPAHSRYQLPSTVMIRRPPPWLVGTPAPAGPSYPHPLSEAVGRPAVCNSRHPAVTIGRHAGPGTTAGQFIGSVKRSIGVFVGADITRRGGIRALSH